MLRVQWKTPDDGQRKCPKHVEFYSKNIFEKLVHLVGFILRIYHDARSPERQILNDELEGVGRGLFYVASWRFPRGTEENREKSVRITGEPSHMRN